jgi:colanic acid biosynthesis protein WcaH
MKVEACQGLLSMRKESDAMNESEAHRAIAALEREVSDAKRLPLEIFKFVSRHAPLVCVDLLIQNKQRQTLMTWRDDVYFGHGWHFPGGVVLHKESLIEHAKRVAREELQVQIRVDPIPLGFLQYFHQDRAERGHQLIFLMRCHSESPPNPIYRFQEGTAPRIGQWAWHSKAPDDLLPVQRAYADILNWKTMTAPAGICMEFPSFVDAG